MILVTGGTGLLGSHLLFKLVSEGKNVRALKRKDSSTTLVEKVFSYYSEKSSELFSRIEWITGDILDYYSLLEALEGVEFLYHAAAQVSFHSSDAQTVISTNVEGTANVVNAALEKKIRKLCFVSSIGALGRVDSGGIVDEVTNFNPNQKNSMYSTSKYEAEREVWRGMAEGLNAVIVNPSIIIGPGNWNSGSSQMFTTLWKGLKFYTDGTNGFVEVNDVAKAMIMLTEGDFSGERYILSSENVSYKQYFEWMADEMKVKPPKIKAGKLLSFLGVIFLKIKNVFTSEKHSITAETARTANRKYAYSNRKFVDATGMKFISVEESVRKTARIFLQEHSG
jgi:nucleoside-diphosphate-sugar epimerase